MLALLVLVSLGLQAQTMPADFRDTVAWYDTLGYPDVTDLPYVRVATGLSTQEDNKPAENTFVEGFLVKQEGDAFWVFLCSVPRLTDDSYEPYTPLTTARFVRKLKETPDQLVDFEPLDFERAANAAIDRLRAVPANRRFRLTNGREIPHRARVFAFARVALQKGHPETAAALAEIAASIPGRDGKKPDAGKFQETMQQDIGDAVIRQVEEDFDDLVVSREQLLKVFEDFGARFPASSKLDQAREYADQLRTTLAEEAVHRAKPIDQMTPLEQVEESIYQLRNLNTNWWDQWNEGTPMQRLAKLGILTVPSLLEALDDRRLSRTLGDRTTSPGAPPEVMRVSDLARAILEKISGRSFYQVLADREGNPAGPTTKLQATTWWSNMQSKGEKQLLIEAVSAGGEENVTSAKMLVDKYPEVAIGAIQAAIRATGKDYTRAEFIEAAGHLSGDSPVAFLKSKLAPTPDNGIHSQIAAAGALLKRDEPGAVAPIIDAWRNLQPRLTPSNSDTFFEAGRVISFLAKSGSAKAINALSDNIRTTPVDVRLSLVQMFLPWPRAAGEGSAGLRVRVDGDISELPGGDAGRAIERLLIEALGDTEKRTGMTGVYDEVSYADPRICDMAALTLSKRWPEKYQFQWSANETEREAQVAKLRLQTAGTLRLLESK